MSASDVGMHLQSGRHWFACRVITPLLVRRSVRQHLFVPFPAVLALLVACSSRTADTPQHVDDPELDVAAAALAEFTKESASGDVILLSHEMWPRTQELPDSSSWVTQRSSRLLGKPPELSGLYGAFWTANRTPRRLPASFVVAGRTVQLVEERSDSANRANIYYVSRVGFNAGQDSAIVFVASLCGILCGHGAHYLYARSPAGWHDPVRLSYMFF